MQSHIVVLVSEVNVTSQSVSRKRKGIFSFISFPWHVRLVFCHDVFLPVPRCPSWRLTASFVFTPVNQQPKDPGQGYFVQHHLSHYLFG